MLAYVYSVNDPRVLDLHYLELMKTLIGVHQALLMHDVFILSTYGRRKCTLRNQIGTSTHTRGSTDKHGSLNLELYNRKNPSNCRSVRNQFPFPISLDLNFCSSPFNIFSANGCKLAIIIQDIQSRDLPPFTSSSSVSMPVGIASTEEHTTALNISSSTGQLQAVLHLVFGILFCF
jgi:hypothetical protein